MCQLSIETSCNIAPTHSNVLPIRNGCEEGHREREVDVPQFKKTDTRGPAVSGRSRLPFPRERRPGALSLFLNHLNYQLIYAPGFTAPQCPRGAAVRNSAVECSQLALLRVRARAPDHRTRRIGRTVSKSGVGKSVPHLKRCGTVVSARR